MIEIINQMDVYWSEYTYISEIVEYLAENLQGDYSLVVTSFFGENYAIKDRLPRTKFKTIAFITGDEWNQKPAYLDDPNLLLMFKTCVPVAGQHPKLLPLPLGTFRRFNPTREYPILERSYDLTFFGQVTCPQRLEMVDAVESYVKNRNNDPSRKPVTTFLSYTKSYAAGEVGPYSEIMNDTKIALNPSPGSNVTVDSTRFFEGMAAGCVVMSTRRPDTWFYDGAPYIPVDDWRDAGPLIDDILRDPDKMRVMSRASYAWWDNICCPRAVGKYIIEKIRQI